MVGGRQPSAEWANTTRLGAYDPTAIRTLKDNVGGDLYVSGSGRLVRALLRDGLVDQLHLFVYPVVLGSGERLLASGETSRLTLLATDAYANGVVHLSYAPA